MQKTFRFLARLTILGIFISLPAGFAEFRSHGKSHGRGNAFQTELAVDDGTFETTLGRSEGGVSWRVNRLTPNSYPATLDAVSIYFRSNSRLNVGDPLTIVFGSNPSGVANIDGIQLQTLEGAVQVVGEFNVYNIPPLTISSGDFVIGYRIDHPQGVYPFAVDTTPPSQRRSYRSLDGVTYTINDDIQQTYTGNYGIRGRLQAQTQDGLFQRGDVFVSINDGRIQWRRASGALVQTLDTGEGGLTAGMAFDDRDNLYVTSFTRNRVHRFSPAGRLMGTFGSGYDSHPESIVFDRTGNIYVGEADTKRRILKFSAAGNLLATFSPAREGRGTDWIELAADQCTMFYTSEGKSVRRFDVCKNTQLSDFATGLPGTQAFALRLLPDGGLIVADQEFVVRLDATGKVVHTYDAPGEEIWFAANLDPDGKSFWSAGIATGNVYKFDLETGNQLQKFNIEATPQPGTAERIDGLAIFDEIKDGLCPEIKTISPDVGAVGTAVTITGKNLIGVSSVKFANNVAAAFTVIDNTQITATVPNGAVSGPITITKPDCPSAMTPVFTVASCNYSINPSSQKFPSDGGSGSVAVKTQEGCAWTSKSNATWIRITSGGTGTSNGAVNFSVEANTGPNERTGTMTIAGKTFTVTQDGKSGNKRVVRFVCPTIAYRGDTLVLPIELVSQGDENALGFSLNFDPAILSDPKAAGGTDANGAQFIVNSGQVAQGRIGIAIALSSGKTFSAGVRQIAVVTFKVSETTTATSTSINFGDSPIGRQVSNANAQVLNAGYEGCTNIPIAGGYEADVTPRPNGKNNGTIAITDWVQVGRFVARLDTAAAGGEFQRADCAPRNNRGDGQLSIIDWVQAGRYAAGLDPVQFAGGPTSLTTLASMRVEQLAAHNAHTRVLRVVNAISQRGRPVTLEIEIEAEGDENALGFSLNFDPSRLSYVSASAGSGIGDALLIPNANQAVAGRLGIALALPAGQTLKSGKQTIVTVSFDSQAGAAAASTPIGFGDQPIHRQVSDANAFALASGYNDGSVSIIGTATNVSAASFKPEIAAESIAAVFASSLAATTAVSNELPLPTTLEGMNVRVRDSAGVERLAPIFFVSPQQINYQVPAGTLPGPATITITRGGEPVAAESTTIGRVAPALFTANSDGQGIAGAVVLRVKADGSQIYEQVARFDAAQGRFVPLPIDLGPETDQLFLILFGTGLRNRSSLSAATCTIGETNAEVLFVGPQGGYIGLDQVNVRLPRSLSGRGEIDLTLDLDGRMANKVRLSIR